VLAELLVNGKKQGAWNLCRLFWLDSHTNENSQTSTPKLIALGFKTVKLVAFTDGRYNQNWNVGGAVGA
jgi:hypothetical protein